MRTLTAYLFALAAVAAGVWFGFLRDGDDREATGSARRASSAPPVVLAIVVEAPFADTLEALGTAIANESVELTANRSELIKAVHFDDGQQVEAGALLLELETAEEASMLAEAQALLRERETSHARAVELLERDISPESDVQTALAQLEAARSRVKTLEVAIEDHSVRAPFAGVLGLRRVSVGSLLQPSTVIATLDDLSVVKVDFTVPETWLAAVRVGQPVAARTDAWPDRPFAGAVSAIDTRLDRTTRSATVRALVPNPGLLLRPGMLLKVDVDRGEQPSLQVPEDAVVQRGTDHFVFVVGNDSIAHETAIEVGRRQIGKVEVLNGVDAGQRIVVQGLVRVRDAGEVDVVGVRNGGS